eukprot:jgi/Hompol1/3845/HPOL_006782-RA
MGCGASSKPLYVVHTTRPDDQGKGVNEAYNLKAASLGQPASGADANNIKKSSSENEVKLGFDPPSIIIREAT